MQDVGPLPLRARLTRLQLAIAALAVAFAGLAALVVGGRLGALDRYALAHWMPGLDPTKATHLLPSLTGLIVPFRLGTPGWQKLLEVVTYPASVGISLLVFAAACGVLVRRGLKTAALVWASAWIVANALEVIEKVVLEKPALTASANGTSYHLVPFDHSFPSGHTMRAVLVAAVAGFVWTRIAWPAAGWAVLLVPVCLVVTAAHVPSDVAGGLLFGLLVVLATYAALGAARARRP
jgi:membrane-associated phospholipid phosphatase